MSRSLLLRRVAAAFLLTIATVAPGVAADFPGKPANPGRQELHNSYRSNGQFANGYRPLSVWTYQNTARSNAQALGNHGQVVTKIDPATAKEHVAEVRRNVEASKKELAKIDDATAKKADIQEHIAAMKKHYDAALTQCTHADKTIAAGGNKDELGTCCLDMDKELKAAEVEHKKLLDSLHISLPQPTGSEAAKSVAK